MKILFFNQAEKKFKSHPSLVLFLILQFFIFNASPVSGGDLPGNPNVQIGNPTITSNGTDMTINAGSADSTWIDWQGGFNIGAQNSVNNIGPSAAAAILHNDISGSISNIQGALNGNCNVFLLNPSGILFAPGSQVNVGGLVASTLRMSQDDFMSKNYNFYSDSIIDASAVVNAGNISAHGAGGVTLMGGAVRNEGVINTDFGIVNLVSGKEVTLSINGEGSVQAAVTEKLLNNVYDQDGNKVDVGVENLGSITANGGKVYIQTEAVDGVFDTLVNQAGSVKAGEMVMRDGKIMLVSNSEGIIENTGILDASAIEAGADGGEIVIEGGKVGQFGEVYVDSIDGNGGEVDIYARETVLIGPESITTANAGLNGDGGEIIIFSPDTAMVWNNARLEAKGGSVSGDGGFIETSGRQYISIGAANINVSSSAGAAGIWLIDPTNITLSDAATADMAGSPNWAPVANPATGNILISAIEASLLNGASSVTVTTASAHGNAGTIIIDGNIDVDLSGGGATPVELTLNANDSITYNAGHALIVDGDNAGDIFTLDLNATTVVVINSPISTVNSGSIIFESAGTTFANSAAGLITTNNQAVTLVHSGNVTIGGKIDAGTAAASFTSGGDITTSLTTEAIAAGALTLITTTAGDTIGTVTGTDPLESTYLTIDATSITASSQQGHIIIKDMASGIQINSITTNDVKDTDDATRIILEAVAGPITSDGDAAVDIDAWTVNLVTSESTGGTNGGPIGATGANMFIATDVSVLNATADNGGIYIIQPDAIDIILGNISANTDGAAAYKNDDGIVVTNSSNNRGTFDVVISAGKVIVMGGEVKSPDVVSIIAAVDIYDAHDGNDFVARYLTLTATGGAVGQSANNVDVIVENLTAISAGGGDATDGVYITETKGTTVDTVTTTNGSVEITANLNNLSLGDGAGGGLISAANGSVTLDSLQGNITDNNVAANNITAQVLVLSAETGIGTNADPIETTLAGGALSLSATAEGEDAGIYIDETNALTTLTVVTNTGAVDIDYGAKNLAFGSTEILAVDDAALTTLSFKNTGGDLKLNGITIGTLVTLEASAAIIQSGNKITVPTVNLTAGTYIGAAGASRIATNVTTLTATAKAGDVYIVEDNALTLTASAAGTTKDVVVVAAGDMTINAITATQAVTLTATAGSILDGNTTTNNISGTATTLVAGAGAIGATGDVIESTVAGAIAATATTGVFLTNTGDVTGLTASVTNAAAANLDITFTNTGTTKLVALSAEDTITITSSGAITGTDGGANDITAAALTVTARSFGAAGAANWIETNVDTYTSIVTRNGGVYIDDTAGGVAVTAITAGGSGSDVYFKSAGALVLSAITASGDDVVINVTGNITDGNGATTNVTADTLDITASGTIGAGDALELSINQIAGTNTSLAVVNQGAMKVKATTLAGTNIDITADEITIFDNGAANTTIGGGSLKLTATYGNIVFLNTGDTITAATDIELYALYDGDPTGVARIDNVTPGRIVVGNLTSTGGNIYLAAYTDITLGHLTAAGSTVAVYAATSAFAKGTFTGAGHTAATHGLILDGNAATANITAGTAYVYAKMHASLAAELEREGAIADYAGRVAETNAKIADVNNLTTLTNGYQTLSNTAASVLSTAQSTYTSTLSEYDTESSILDDYNLVMNILVGVRAVAQIVKDVTSFPSAAAQAIPLSGDGGGAIAGAVVDLVFSIADGAMLAYELAAVNPQEDEVADLQADLDVATANQYSALNDYNDALDEYNTFNDTLGIATAVQTVAETARDHAQIIRTQALSSDVAGNAIGSDALTGASGDLEIVAANVNVTTAGVVTTGAAATNLVDATTVTLTTVGDITIINDNDVGLSTVNLSTDKDISYTQTGDQKTLLGNVITSSSTGTITVTTNGEIYGTDGGGADISAPTITLIAATGGVGQTGQLEINATSALNVTTTGDNGNITIEDVTGDLPVGAINAGTGDVSLISAGIIADAAVDTTADITAADLGMDAITGIGEGAALETVLSGVYAATTDSGDMVVTFTGGVTVGVTGGVTGATITDGGAGDSISLISASPLTVNAVVTNAGGGDISLVADGTTDNDDMAINAAITASGGNGNITLYAGDTITQAAAIAVTAAGSGNINYYAGVDYNGGTPQAGLNSGLSNITMVTTSTAVSGTGNITMTAPRDITLGFLTTVGNVTVTADDSTYITSNSDGDINDASAAETANIKAATATLRAATGIGSGVAANDIETDITTLDALNSTSGDINVYEIDGATHLIINRVTQSTAGNINVQTNNGNLTIAASQSGVTAVGAGTITLIAGDSDANNGDNLTINDAVSGGTGVVTLTSATNDVIFGSDGDVTTTSGLVDVNASGAGGAGVILMADGALINAGDDLITLDANANITLGGLLTTSASNTAVVITSVTGGIIDGGDTHVDVAAASGRLVVDAVTGIGTANDIETTVASIDLDNSTSGDMSIDETDALTIIKAVQAEDDSITILAGTSVSVDAGGSGVIIDDTANNDGDADILIRAEAGTLTVSQIVRNDSDHADADIVLDADGATSSTAIAAAVSTAAGDITITADDDVTFAAAGDVTATGAGNIVVTADNDSVDSGSSGALTMTDGALIDGGAGTITVKADENITLGGLLTTNNTGSAVGITSTSGGIIDGGATHTDIAADTVGAVVTIDAVTGVGSADALDTQVATIDIDNVPVTGANATGHIQIVELDTAAGGLIIQKAVQGDVGVEATNKGNINISTVDGLINITGAVTARDGATIIIDANDAGADETFSLTVGALVTSSVGLKDVGVGVVTAGAITLSADDDVDVNFKVSNSNANASYTANDNILVTADTGDALLDAEIAAVGSSNVTVVASNDVLLGANGDITTVTGNVTVTADSNGDADGSGGELQMNDNALINSGSGIIALNADEDITLGGLLTTSSSDTAAVLTTTSGGIVDGGATAVDVVAADGRLVINAVTGVGTAGNIDTTIASVDIDNTTSNNIDINETDALSVYQIDQDGAGNINVDAGGIVTITASTGFGVTATSGVVEIDANGVASDVVVNEQILTTSGAINVYADNDVTFGVDGDVTSGGAGNILVNADADSVADGSSGAITMTDSGGDSTIISGGTGVITLNADENITLGGVTTNNVANASVIIWSGNGSILDGGDTAVDIDANTTADTSGARITAETGIGTDANGIETTIETLSATSVTGDIHVINTGDLQIINSALNGAQITGGSSGDNIIIQASSPLTVVADVVNAGGGNIILAAEGTATTDDLIINDVVTASVGNGSITLYAGDTITQNSVAVTAAGSGDITYYAGTDYNSGTVQAGLATGASDIVMDNAATAVSITGNISMLAPDSVSINVITTGGNAIVTADYAGYIAANNVGEINEVAGEGTANITASTATLRAATGIGSADDIETIITNLDALNSTSGDINVTELAAGAALGINRATQTALGDIFIHTLDGSLTVTVGQSGVSLTTGELFLNAGDAGSSANDDLIINASIVSTTGKLNLDATNDVIFGAAGDVTTTSGEIEVLAVDAITMADGALLNAGDDQIDLDSDEDITLGGLITTYTADDAIVITTVSGGVVDGGDSHVDIVANTASAIVDIDAVTGIGSTNALETSIFTLEARNTTSGDIKINETDAINLSQIINLGTGLIESTVAGTITTSVISSAGAINLYATDGDIYDTVGGMMTAGATSSLKASGIIGSSVGTYNPVDVNITGDLWVWTASQVNEVSAILRGVVNGDGDTQRAEIYDPTPPGLVLFNNHLMGGANYGGDSVSGSILSHGYGYIANAKSDVINMSYQKALQPWGYKISLPWVLTEGAVIDADTLKPVSSIIDISPLNLPALEVQMNKMPNYYIIYPFM